MKTIEQSTEVDRPISEVWDLWTDVRILPDLSSSTVAVLAAPNRLTTEGQTFRQVLKALGRCMEVEWTVTEIEPGDHLTIAAQPKLGVRVRLTEIVEAIAAERTRMTLRIEYKLPFGPLGAVASSLGIEQLATKEAAAVLDGLEVKLASGVRVVE